MSEREKIYVFDDGSIESKLLQHELKDKYDIQVVGVNIANDIIECFEKIQPDKKVHLHYTYEKYAADHEKLRRDIQKVEHLGFRNLIVLDYEGLDSKTAEYRSKEAGLNDIKLTGKPEAIAIDIPTDVSDLKDLPSNKETKKVTYDFIVKDPDDEMKEQVGIDKPYISIPGDKIEEDKPVKKSRFRKKFL